MKDAPFPFQMDFQKRFKYPKLRPQENLTFGWFKRHNHAGISTFAHRNKYTINRLNNDKFRSVWNQRSLATAWY